MPQRPVRKGWQVRCLTLSSAAAWFLLGTPPSGDATARSGNRDFRSRGSRSLWRTLRRGQVCAQFLCCAPGAVAGRVTLNAPTLTERSDVDGVEAELIEQGRDLFLRGGIVASDCERSTIRRTSRLAVGGQLSGVDVIERLDHLRRGQMLL